MFPLGMTHESGSVGHGAGGGPGREMIRPSCWIDNAFSSDIGQSTDQIPSFLTGKQSKLHKGPNVCYFICVQVIRGLVTLGAPHYPPPPPIKDMTQGALRWTSMNFPGAHVKEYGIACVSVGSDRIVGEEGAPQGSPVSDMSELSDRRLYSLATDVMILQFIPDSFFRERMCRR